MGQVLEFRKVPIRFKSLRYQSATVCSNSLTSRESSASELFQHSITATHITGCWLAFSIMMTVCAWATWLTPSYPCSSKRTCRLVLIPN